MSTAGSTCSVPTLPKTSLERYFKGFLDSSFSSLKGGGKNGKRPSTPFQSLEQDDFSTSIATTEPNDITKDLDIKDKSSTTAQMSASMTQQQQNKDEKLNSSFSASSNNNNQCYMDRNIELVAVIDQQQQSRSSKSSSFSTNANDAEVFGNDSKNIKQGVGGIGAVILTNEGDPYVGGEDDERRNRLRKDSWTSSSSSSSSSDDDNNVYEIDDDELVDAYQDEDSLKEFYQLNILPADVLPQVQSPLSPRSGKNKEVTEEKKKKEEQVRHCHYEIPQSISITISNDADDDEEYLNDGDEDGEDTQGCALSVQECQDEYSFEKFYQLAIPDEIKKQQRLRPLVSPPSTPSSSRRGKNRKYQKVKKGNKKSTTTSTTNTTDNNGFVSPRDVVTYCDTPTASTNGKNTAADYDSTIMELVGWLTPQSGPSNQKRKVYIDQFVAAKTSNTSSTTNDDCPTSPLGVEEDDDDEEDHGLDDDDNDYDCNDSQLSEDDSYGRRGQRTTKIFDIDLQLPSSLALPF